jgi:TonB family protein
MNLAILLLTAITSLYPQELSHTTDPKIIRRTDPQYTKEALGAKIEGNVILSSVIGVDGAPSDIKLVRGLGMGLDEKAVECLKQWRFSPATDRGKPVSTTVTIAVNFRSLGRESSNRQHVASLDGRASVPIRSRHFRLNPDRQGRRLHGYASRASARPSGAYKPAPAAAPSR